MEALILLPNEIVKKYDLNLTEFLAYNFIIQKEVKTPKELQLLLSDFNFKKDTCYRIFKSLSEKGLINYELKNLSTNGSIYVVLCNRTNLYKIGFARDVVKRVKTLKTANPSISLCFSVENVQMSDEKILHETFKNKRISGEWFDLMAIDLIYIKNFKKSK